MKIAIFGAAGNMGLPVLKEIVKLDFVEHINLLIHSKKSKKAVLKALNKVEKAKVSIFLGSISDYHVVRRVVNGTGYVINMAAVIPPLSDKKPLSAIEANEDGVNVLIKAIEEIKENQPKFIHVSTVGLYGSRNEKHLFGEVGDPLLVSPFDIYAVTKMRGEFAVLESNIACWTVIRQSAMLYPALMMKNVSDGLMFHTCFNAPLEWVSDKDSAVLFRNILIREHNNELNYDNFWKKVFNLAGGKANRITGFETLEEGFRIIGGSTKKFFKTNYNALRNFHGLYYRDGDKLEELFHYQHETVREFWTSVLKKHPYFALAKILPQTLLRKLVIDPLLKDNNAPMYWVKHHDEARILAYFGSLENYNNIPKKWDDFPLNNENRSEDGGTLDYSKLRETSPRINHYFDYDKPDSEIDINDLRNVAEAHAGKLISKDFKKGDIYQTLEWENQDGERFFAKPFTILRAGHWVNVTYSKYAWDFDRLAKKDKIYQEVWYDSHSKDENHYYYYDENYDAQYKDNK